MRIDVRRLKTGRTLLVGALVAGAVAAGGTATAFAANGGDDDGPGERAAETQAVRTAKVNASEAAGIALRTVPGHVVSVDLDDDDHGKPAWSWEVEVVGKDGAKRELKVDTASGKVLANVPDDKGDDGKGEDDD